MRRSLAILPEHEIIASEKSAKLFTIGWPGQARRAAAVQGAPRVAGGGVADCPWVADRKKLAAGRLPGLTLLRNISATQFVRPVSHGTVSSSHKIETHLPPGVPAALDRVGLVFAGIGLGLPCPPCGTHTDQGRGFFGRQTSRGGVFGGGEWPVSRLEFPGTPRVRPDHCVRAGL